MDGDEGGWISSAASVVRGFNNNSRVLLSHHYCVDCGGLSLSLLACVLLSR